MLRPQIIAHREGHGIPEAPEQETGPMFAEAATRVGFAYAASLAVVTVLLHIVA